MAFVDRSRFAPFPNKVWLASPTMHGKEMQYLTETWLNGNMTADGENIDWLERFEAERVGKRHAVAVSSCTAALHLCVRLAGERLYGRPEIGRRALEGRRVFCSDLTFAGGVNPLIYEGAIPVFIDTEATTWNMDPVALEKAFELYPEVKLVLAVQLYGFPGRMDRIKCICEQHDALLIEDAAEAMGATIDGRQCGSFGDYSAMSYNGNKIITGSSGGCLLTDSDEDAERARQLSQMTCGADAPEQSGETGYSYRLSNVIAGVIRGQYPYLGEHIARKKRIYDRYVEGMKGLPVYLDPIIEATKPNYWLSALIIAEEAMCQQERSDTQAVYVPETGRSCPTELLEAIASLNAVGRPIWKPMHLQPMYRENACVGRVGILRSDTNARMAGRDGYISSDLFRRGICLPSDIKMTEEEQDTIIRVIRACFA